MHGGGGVPNRSLSCSLLQTRACNVGGHTHTHTHTLATWTIALHVLCFPSLEKCFHCVRRKKKWRQNPFNLISKFKLTYIFLIKLKKRNVWYKLHDFEISKNSNYLDYCISFRFSRVQSISSVYALFSVIFMIL